MIKGCAVVTGASRGIGAACAFKLAETGLPVVVNYSSRGSAALDTLEKIKENGGDGFIFKADVSKRDEVDAMMNEALKQYGRIDTLVNNAGVSQIKLFTDITPDDWRRMVSVNLDGVFNCCQSALPSMIHNKYGRIVNISSVWGVYGASCEVHYSAVKAGIIGLTKALAMEVAPSGITVNAVAPGCIMTDMLHEDCDEETIKQLAADSPVGRIGTPEDVAKAVAFLAGKASGFITGQVLGVDGGFK